MFERICYALLYLCGIVLGYYLILWVLRELGIPIPEMVLKVVMIMLVIVAILVLFRLFRGALGNLRLWPRDPGPPSCFLLLCGLAISLIACNSANLQPADSNVTARIVSACMYDGVFKNLGGRLVLSMIPVPGVNTADQILAAGVDRVCANPEAFSKDISTVEWVVKNIRKN